jgi:hypothetical protein
VSFETDGYELSYTVVKIMNFGRNVILLPNKKDTGDFINVLEKFWKMRAVLWIITESRWRFSGRLSFEIWPLFVPVGGVAASRGRVHRAIEGAVNREGKDLREKRQEQAQSW